MNTEHISLMKPYYLQDASLHTMGSSLLRYLEMKVHEAILTTPHDLLIVRGWYDRSQSHISRKEKKDKLFNWQRPTTNFHKNTLYLNTYPSMDYVRHYAALVATYLQLTGKNPVVRYILPSEQECWMPLLSSCLSQIPVTDIAIIGYGLSFLGTSDWQGTSPFKFQTIRTRNAQATLIGCEHSIWGDAGGRVVAALMHQGYKKVVYIGKLGSLVPEHAPNTLLATGSCSYLQDEFITWDNIFASLKDEDIIHGTHYCCPSVVYETTQWKEETAKNFTFVDPEIGQMAKYAQAAGGQFSYLHIISDNLAKKYTADLSNERQREVLLKRKNLLHERIRHIIHNL